MNEAQRRWIWWVAVVVLVCPTGASATSVIDVSLDQLTRSSTVVVRGQVSSVESRWVEDGGSIVTLVRIGVDQALKGTGVGELVIEVEGGRVGDRVMVVTGNPIFTVGEEVLLFLTRGPAGRYHVVEAAQEKYSIAFDSEGHAWIDGYAGRLPLERFMGDLLPLTNAQGGGKWLR